MEPHVLSEQELKFQNEVMDKADAIVEAKIAEEEAQLRSDAQNSDKNTSGRDWRRLFGKGRHDRKPHTRVMFAALNIAVLMLGVTIAGSNIVTMYPYAITANDEVICYVDDKDVGTDAVQKAVADLAKDDSDIILFSTGDDFKIARSFEKTKSNTELKTADEAAGCITEAISKAPDKFPEIAIASTRTETRTFTPDPIYVKNDNALAGTTVVKEESIDGKKAVTIDYVTVNGEVVKEEETKEEILDEGRSATIEKGILGLPDGEAWETYEGDPVYKDGAELVKTAMSYVGKVRYVRGGTSLTKGVDCTGFVQQIYKLYGIKLKPGIRHEGISVSYKNAQPGDVICYAHHYAIYIGNGKIVHAAGPKYGVIVSKTGVGGKITDVRRIVR
jgi:cell wall-associated NlpC family hydrolase